MTAKWRIDLAPLRPSDAPALRRFAVALERRYPRHGVVGDALRGIVAGLARKAADRLDAGEIQGRL